MAIATFPERDYKANYVVCTSTTRPPPFNGLQIYETDTGKNLIYRAVAPVGWYPPWNTAWGRVARMETASPPGWVTLVSTQATLSAVPVLAGRIYTVKMQCRYRSDVVDTLTLFTLDRSPLGAGYSTMQALSATCALVTASNMSVWVEAHVDFTAAASGNDDFRFQALRQTATSATHTSSYASIAVIDSGI